MLYEDESPWDEDAITEPGWPRNRDCFRPPPPDATPTGLGWLRVVTPVPPAPKSSGLWNRFFANLFGRKGA